MSFAIAVFVVATCTNGTLVDNTTDCDYFATRTFINSTYDCCECEADFAGNGTSCELETKLECSSTSLDDGYAFRVLLNQSFIDHKNISTSSLRLMNASCNNVTLENGYYVLYSPTYDDCGSIKSNSSASIVYTNAVSNDGGTVASGEIIRMEFQCTVSATLNISLTDPNGNPLSIPIQSVSSDEIVFPVQEGTGQVTARMYLFRDSNYNEAYNGIPLLSTSDMLYVMIGLDGDSLNGIKLISRECWATPDVAGESSERFDIIEQPGCLKSSVNGGSITRNGETNNARFQLPVFTFLPSNIIYLHCAVQLCTTNDCVPTCSSRRKRETNSLNVQILRSQLIIRSDDKIWDPPIVENPTDKPSDDNLTSNTFLIIIILLTITGIFLLAIIALLIYVCITRRRKLT